VLPQARHADSDEIIPGPYQMSFRKAFLRKLLEAQIEVNQNAPPGEKTVLIHDAELLEIRRLWRAEAGDWEDTVVNLVREVLGRVLPIEADGAFEFDAGDGALLAEVCAEYDVPPELLAQLLEVERSVRGLKRRAAVHQRIAGVMEREWRSQEAVLAEREARSLKGAS